MTLEKHCEAVVKSFEEDLGNHYLTLLPKCTAPLSNGCRHELDITVELKAAGLHVKNLLEFHDRQSR